MRKPRTPTEADIRRFWSKVDKTSSRSGCWLWTAGCFDNGYAAFSVGQNRPGHVIAYELTIGPVPDGLQLDHTCHDPTRCAPPCPHRRCVNPAHLEPVTPRENTLRSGALSALNAAKTQCPEGHPLSGVNLAVTGGPTGHGTPARPSHPPTVAARATGRTSSRGTLWIRFVRRRPEGRHSCRWLRGSRSASRR
jgi:hypothetical protein